MRQERQDMSVKVTKNFKPLVPFIVKKPLKSAKNNLSLDGAKKKNYAFGLKVSFQTKKFIEIFYLPYLNILEFKFKAYFLFSKFNHSNKYKKFNDFCNKQKNTFID